jgi:uncharacterized protein (DUF302 family)
MTTGLVTVRSVHSVAVTIDRLAAAVAEAGLRVFARIDHGQGAADAGLELRPTELLIFGHARGGTPLMQDRQTAGIDLPLKALAWEDAEGTVWVTYNDAAWLAERHGIARSTAVTAIGKGTELLVDKAASGRCSR